MSQAEAAFRLGRHCHRVGILVHSTVGLWEARPGREGVDFQGSWGPGGPLKNKINL